MASAETASAEGRSNPGTAAGVYVHLPFCSEICPYCDFAVTVGGVERRRALVDALCEEIDLGEPAFEAPVVDTIYFGGGTPSIHEPGEIAEIVSAVRGRFEVDPEPGVYLEANPEDVTRERLDGWRSLGVGTLSLGVQSLDDEALRFLGRRHTVEEAHRAVRLARQAGFETLSIDLIYGRPGQTVSAWEAELERAVALAPDHLSCYQLTIHKRTKFGRWHARGRFEMPPDPQQAELFLTTHRGLADLGFAAYEVSNFARGPEHSSLHNLKYWTGVPYLGLGPSAHSFDGSRRWWNLRLTHRYVEQVTSGGSPVEEIEALTPAQRALEQIMLGFRLADGIDLGKLEAQFGVGLVAPNESLLDGWLDDGLVTRDRDHIRATLAGLLLADRLPGEIRIEE